MGSKSIFNRVVMLEAKSRKLKATAKDMDAAAQKILDELAAAGRVKFKKGQIFKKRGEAVWAKLLSVDSLTINRCALNPTARQFPYVLACKRCTVKGVVDTNKWIFIAGQDVGTAWVLVNPKLG